jgi:hypothetical protein
MAVCLHCLHTARVEARDRRQRTVIRISLWTLGLAVVGAAGVGAIGRHPAPTHPSRAVARRVAPAPKPDSTLQIAAMPVIPQGSADTTHVPVRDTSPAPIVQPVATPHRTVDSITPVVAMVMQPALAPGRTELADSMFAVRSGDTVVVHFDTSPLRTRRADKFERIVRQTLAAVYGPVADTLLATVPDGRLAAPNDLLNVLPAKGVHLATASGRRVGLWPETRPGRDGPLVVSYRTLVER